MKKHMIQFHAAPVELAELLSNLRKEIRFSMAIIGWRPFALTLIGESEEYDFCNIADVAKNTDIRIALSCRKSLIAADSEGHFFDKNPDCVIIDIGEFSQNMLGESAISFMSSDLDAIEFVNKVISKLKKITSAGAIAVNPETGVEGRVRTHRYTEGAKDLFVHGTKIMSIGGKTYFKLEPESVTRFC